MNDPSDTSPEMHNESLSPEDVERLLDGSSERPDLADVERLFGEVRALPAQVAQPAVSAALSEFIGVDLTPTNEPIALPQSSETVISLDEQVPEAEPVRRTSMIGHAAAFLGTMGGKVALGTTLAAASVGGAHATGAVDVPFLPDTNAAVIETVDLPEGPDPLAFFEDVEDVEDVKEDDSVESDAVEVEEAEKIDEDTPTEKPHEKEKAADFEDDLPPRQEDKIVPADDDVEEEKDESVEEEKVEAPKKEEPKKEPKKEESKDEPKDENDKTDAEIEAQELIGALDEALHIAKDKVRADATALIKPLEVERDGLLADLEAAHKALAEEWEPIIDALLADLEATTDETERAEIEADIDAAETAWADARVAAELEVDPRLEEIDELFHQIETERDEELNRLIAEFLAAVEEIENTLK